MNKLILLLVLVLVLIVNANSQTLTTAQDPSPKVLLEARYVGAGMAVPLGKLLIARITSDGRVQFDDKKLNRDGVLERYIVGVQLRGGVPARLRELLASEKIALLQSEYEAVYPTIDHSQDLLLKLLVNGEVKEIRVNNFKPGLPKSKNVYPQELIELACIAESARINASILRFFSDVSPCSFR